MTTRRAAKALAATVLALAVAAPVLEAGERKPKGGTSGGSARASQPAGAPASRPARTAVPRTSAPPATQPAGRPERRAVPRTEPPSAERAPRAQPQRRPDVSVPRSRFPVFLGPYRWHPWGWWGGYWHYPWYPWYPWGVGVYAHPEPSRSAMGALDLDVVPEKAQVYVDGELVGVADNFDGWPDYLWLEEGTYDLVFFHEGYETLARRFTVRPGVILRVDDRLTPGEATPPEELFARSTEARDERLRRRIERGEAPAGEPDWRERVRAQRAERGGEELAYDARREPARLRLAVDPPDAAVYLDGRFLGAGEDLVGFYAGLMVDPGEHELEVVRPGYESLTTRFTAEAGEEVALVVELESNR